MNFQSLTKIETTDFYIDQAFKRAKETVRQTKSTFQNKRLTRLQKSRFIELEKVQAFAASLKKSLMHILISFPSIDRLEQFYQELIKCTLNYELLKKSLGAVNWATMQITRISDDSCSRIKLTKEVTKVNDYSRMGYGRIASVLKQVKQNLEMLDEARKIMKEYPAIKTSMPTIVIAGFPNTGKTTLLKALTGSAPKIAPYPFTTQQLMIGYTEINNEKVQFIDTPGLLDRPFTERNPIEKQAILAIQHLAKKIIFVIDPTQNCGYTLEEQINLLEEIKENFETEIITVINKTDIADKKDIEQTKKKIKNVIEISAEKKQDITKLIEALTKNLNK